MPAPWSQHPAATPAEKNLLSFRQFGITLGGMGNKNKPRVFLNLLQIKLPVTGVVSILHRVSGVLLSLSLPLAIYLLQSSLANDTSYRATLDLLTSPLARLLLLVMSGVFAHHFFTGLRHLCQDVDIGISLPGARRGAWLVFLADILAVLCVAWGLR